MKQFSGSKFEGSSKLGTSKQRVLKCDVTLELHRTNYQISRLAAIFATIKFVNQAIRLEDTIYKESVIHAGLLP